ncbi:MAG: serine/threonine-protein kinase [Pirellulaceae bacterium]
MSNHPTESFPPPGSGDGRRNPSAPDAVGKPTQPSTQSHPGGDHDTKPKTDSSLDGDSPGNSKAAPIDGLAGTLAHELDDSPVGAPVADQVDDPVPKQIGRYTILRVLGSGAFGRVYQAWDNLMHREVALKVPKQGALPPGEQTQRFLEEARAAAKLKHPGIVRIYDIARTDDDRPMLVMEYIAGSTLFAQMAKRRFSVEEACRLIAAVAQALAYAHQHGVFHRDIKPGNILVDEQGTPHVADFGLAVVAEKQWHSPAGKAGTAPYMSPEQVQGDFKQVDGRADIWALGVVLYELLTGQKPFRGQTTMQLFQDILHGDPQPPRQLSPNVPNEVDRACRKCLGKSPDERFTAARDLATELTKWLPPTHASGSPAEPSHAIPSGPANSPAGNSSSDSKPPIVSPPIGALVGSAKPVGSSSPAGGSSSVVIDGSSGAPVADVPSRPGRSTGPNSSSIASLMCGAPALLVVLLGIGLILFTIAVVQQRSSRTAQETGSPHESNGGDSRDQLAVLRNGAASGPGDTQIGDSSSDGSISGNSLSGDDSARVEITNDGGARLPVGSDAGRKKLAADLDVLIWDPVNSLRRNVSIAQQGVAPLRIGDHVRVVVRMERPAHVYLVWIDSLGSATPVFPWSQPSWSSPIERDMPVSELSLPEDADVFWPLEGRPGMETLVLLARETPLPAAATAETWFAGLPVQTMMQNKQALVWFSQGLPIAAGSQARGPKFFDPKRVDDPALTMHRTLAERLNELFPLFRSVSFAKIEREEDSPETPSGESPN